MNDTYTNAYNSNLIIKEGISSSDSENYIGSFKSKGSSSELMNMSMKSNRVLRVFVLSISLLLILTICTSFAMSFSYKRISEFFYSYNNQVIKFQMNRIILYTLYFYFIINKSIYFFSIYLFTDKYLVEAIYKFGKSVLVMNDILMLSNILIGTFLNRVEVMTVISVILSSFELVSLEFYSVLLFNITYCNYKL